MFRSRRRVPSEGALRVLRQLAYISSGTACGAAAVIAEERRRQTTLVSKIADNSRRLKQHPRYQHAHTHAHTHARAARRRATDDTAQSHSHALSKATSNAPVDDDMSRGPPHEKPAPQPDAFRNNLLPSEVERGYAKLDSHRPPFKKHSKDNQSQRHAHPLSRNPPRQVFDRPSFMAALEKHDFGTALAQLDNHCSAWLQVGRPGAALYDFWDAFCALQRHGTPTIYALSAVSRLFHSLLNKNEYTLCCKLLTRMSKSGYTAADLTDCMHSLALVAAAAGHPSLLIWLYENYGHDMLFPRATYPAFCAAYSTHNSEVCALLFGKHISKSDRPSVLPLCESAWSAILEHMWSKTHNYKLVDSLFRDMCHLAESPPLALFNSMIYVCIKSGNVDQAHHRLRSIQQTSHLSPDIVTFGHFVLLTTSSADWPAVDDLMAMLTRAGEAEAPLEGRTDMFIPVLEAYAKLHTPEETWTFVFKAIEEYGVLPDKRILNTATRNLVKTGRLTLIPAWVNKMKTYGQKVEVTSETALVMMRQFYFDLRPSHTVLLWLCQNLLKGVPEYWSEGLLALLCEAASYDLRGYRSRHPDRKLQTMLVLEKLQAVDPKSPVLPKPLRWNEMRRRMDGFQEDMQRLHLEPQEPINEQSQVQDFPEYHDDFLLDDDASLDELPNIALSTAALEKMWNENNMLIALSEGRHSDVLKMYDSCLGQSGLPASSYSLEMAIQAHMKLPDQAVSPEDRIDTANKAGLNTTAALIPLLVHQIRHSASGTPLHIDELCNTVLSIYEKMAGNSVSIKHHLATAAATALLRSGKTNDAILLLSTVFHSKWGKRIPFDLPAMTVLLQAYIKLMHSSGIEWVIKEVLDHNLRIDYAFLTVIRKAHKHSEQRSHDRDIRGLNHLKVSKMLSYYQDVCRAKQVAQIRRASHLGNRLVRIMTKLARSEEEFKAPRMHQDVVDPALWGRSLRDTKRRRTTWRIVGSRPAREARRVRTLDADLRRTRRQRANVAK